MDFDPTPFNVLLGIRSWAMLAGILTVVALGLGLLGSFLTGGANGLAVFGTGLSRFLKELVSISPRRILALATLTVRRCDAKLCSYLLCLRYC